MILRSFVKKIYDTFVEKMRKIRKLSASTIETFCDRFEGGWPSVLDLIVNLPVTSLEQIDFPAAEILRNQIEDIYAHLSIETITGKMAAARKFLDHCMYLGLIKHNPDVLDLYWQKHDRKPLIPLSSIQLEAIHKERFSSDEFLHMRGSAIFVTLANGYAERCEVEPEKAQINDLISTVDGWILRIRGKGNRDRFIRLAYDDTVLMNRYLAARAQVLVNLKCTYEQALFIKKDFAYDSESGDRSGGLGLSKNAIYSIFKRFRDRIPELHNVKPYDLRKNAISRMLVVASILNIPYDEVCIRCGNSVNVAFRHYFNQFDLYTEALRRTPEELVPFLKALWGYSRFMYYMNPMLIEHRASMQAIEQMLGRLQVTLMFKDITAGRLKINLDKRHSIPHQPFINIDFLRSIGFSGYKNFGSWFEEGTDLVVAE
jgi:site-specific recombinase XerD